jgi:predicted O-methyltransferase YrrM
MSPSIVDSDVAGIAEALAPDPDEVQREMHDRAEREGFPHVGPTVGAWLGLLTRLVDADRAFEFGSGFGYSAYWIARELPTDGEVVLTEIDEDELAQAEQYFETGGLGQRARFEAGDAMEIVEAVEGPFDLVLIDHQKERYRDAFEAIKPHVAPGGVVLADNAVTAGPIDTADVRALLDGADRPDATDASRGIADYLAHVRADDEFTSGLLPLGEGLSVSRRRQ